MDYDNEVSRLVSVLSDFGYLVSSTSWTVSSDEFVDIVHGGHRLLLTIPGHEGTKRVYRQVQKALRLLDSPIPLSSITVVSFDDGG